MDGKAVPLNEPFTDQGDPISARCEVCRHQHACFVGGRPDMDPATAAIAWERHICLGCLMRIADPAARDSCADCAFPIQNAA